MLAQEQSKSKKEILPLPKVLNTNRKINAYHRKCRTGIRRNIPISPKRIIMTDITNCFSDIYDSQSVDIIEIDNEKYNILKFELTFNEWKGKAIQNTFGGKTLVDVDGKASFAELAIVDYLQRNGWNARWIGTYGRPPMAPFMLTEWNDVCYKEQVHVPITDIDIHNTLVGIAKLNGNRFSGCWDVVAWKNGINVIEFVRLK